MLYSLDTALTAVLCSLQVENFLVHFWQGMPNHMQPILGCQSTVDLIVVCDFILYRVRTSIDLRGGDGGGERGGERGQGWRGEGGRGEGDGIAAV